MTHHQRRPSISRRLLGIATAGAGLSLAACGSTSEPPAPSTTVPEPEPSAPEPTDDPASDSTDPDEVAERFADSEPRDWGMHMPGIVSELEQPTGAEGQPRIALTFDACGGPSGSDCDEELISGLVAAAVPATLFVNLRWIDANPEVMEELVEEPLFELGNHGSRHVPLSVTGREAYGIAGSASAQEAVDEVWECHERLTALTGEPPQHFRSGTAHYDDVGVAIATALGETPIGFSTNGDAGATLPADSVRTEIAATEPGGIVIAHVNNPGSGTAEGTLSAVEDLLDQGVEFVHL